jgi:hypothetical protein
LVSAPRVFGLSLALENKLFAVRYFHKLVRAEAARAGDPLYQEPFVRDYDDDQAIICAIEGLLGAIYSSLELSAEINRLLHRGLPRGFRRQSKKFEGFCMEGRDWLKEALDLRSLLTHFATSMPLAREGALFMRVETDGDLEILPKGDIKVPMPQILGYANQLFDLLDSWARAELSKLDPSAELEVWVHDDPRMRPRHEKRTIGDLLALLQPLSETD